jgi:hypothetical protein
LPDEKPEVKKTDQLLNQETEVVNSTTKGAKRNELEGRVHSANGPARVLLQVSAEAVLDSAELQGLVDEGLLPALAENEGRRRHVLDQRAERETLSQEIVEHWKQKKWSKKEGPSNKTTEKRNNIWTKSIETGAKSEEYVYPSPDEVLG